jgi:endonuclease/exonuclease/phosphatase family metal-dependent hydrolase
MAFSTGSRDDTELQLIADRLQQYDLIAIQEVQDREVIDRVLAALAERGLDYDAVVTYPVGRSTTERYAFMWRPEEVKLLTGVRMWRDPDDVFIREPVIGDFRAGSFDFSLINIHSIVGDTKAERRAEAELLDEPYNSVQAADWAENDVILLGDFHLPPEDAAFADLDAILDPLITGTRFTTISENAKSLYDNMWFDTAYVSEYTGHNGVDDFDVTVFDNDDQAASLAVSDHRPIWATFHTDGFDDDPRFFLDDGG